MHVRCDDHEDQTATQFTLVAKVEPVDYPNKAVVCGKRDCDKPGLVHLDRDEFWYYQFQRRRKFHPKFVTSSGFGFSYDVGIRLSNQVNIYDKNNQRAQDDYPDSKMDGDDTAEDVLEF